MSLRIYNTLSRALEDFSPIEPGHVRMYVCGVTVYDRPHIGNARSAVAFDVVRRWLEATGYRVEFVRNITDIDDKMIRRAVENGETVRSLAERMTALMYADYDALGILRPTHDPRATDYLPQMLRIVRQLQDKGLAYLTPDHDVNFAVRKQPGYGKLSGKPLDELQSGERVAVSAGKQDPLDFVLWKAAKPQEPEDAKWDSPWGRGRPGWHIECSAMAHALLGETIDIHGGGSDLIFPHHENEIAQSEGAFGVPLARTWMHNGFLNIDGAKMSKSLGNFFSVPEVLEHYDAQTVRFFLVRGHYRSELGWSDKHLDDARAGLRRLYNALAEGDAALAAAGLTAGAVPFNQLDLSDGLVAAFKHAMDEDFGTPNAVATLFLIASEIGTARNLVMHGDDEARRLAISALQRRVTHLRSLGAVLGILQGEPASYLRAGAQLDEATITALIEQRAAAKRARNFAEADRIRNHLAAQGIVLKDSPTGTTWESAS